jgi:uncharacterized protein YaeQ
VALKATVFKAELQLANLDRGYYADHSLTLARHPSETDERLMLRVLAFALQARPALAFGDGLSSDDQPDLWEKDLTGAIQLWIDVGLPEDKLVRKACGRAAQVVVYSYGGHRAELWWAQAKKTLEAVDNLAVYEVPLEASRALAALAQRNMRLQCTIQEGQALFTDGERAVQAEVVALKGQAMDARGARGA